MPGDIPHAGRRAPERRELAVGTGRRAPFQSRPWLEEPEPQCSPRRWAGRVCAPVPEGGRPPAPLGLHRAVCPGRKSGLRVPTAAAPFPLPPAPGLPCPSPPGSVESGLVRGLSSARGGGRSARPVPSLLLAVMASPPSGWPTLATGSALG